jgi:electron transfer flavoprotein alpha subunit
MKFLVFIEQRDGKIRKASLEALSLAARLGGAPAAAVIAGKGVADSARQLGKYGAGKVYVADRDDLALYSNRGYVGALQAAREKESPDAVLIAATAMGKDLAPRFAAKNDAGVLADVMELKVEGEKLVGVRPVYSGKARATVEAASGLRIATTRPNVFPAESNDAGSDPGIETLDLGALEIRAKVTGITTSGGKELDVTEADIVVSGGRGIKGPENWPVVRDLVDAMGSGATLGASRAVVDAGWIDHQYQVGQTGKVVSPTLYVAVGISGAIQHKVGMQNSENILAINKDPNAPIFEFSDLGVVGDLHKIVPKLTEAIKAKKGG